VTQKSHHHQLIMQSFSLPLDLSTEVISGI